MTKKNDIQFLTTEEVKSGSYVELTSNKIDVLTPYQRNKAFPIDRSSMFSSLEDAKRYAEGLNEQGKPVNGTWDTRRLAGTSYVGQIISVYSGSLVKVYKIEENRTLTELASASGAQLDLGRETEAREAADNAIKDAVGLTREGNLPDLTGTNISGAKSIVDALEKLDAKTVSLPTVEATGVEGEFIQTVQQTDGSIKATPIKFATVEEIREGMKKAPSAEAVAAYVKNNKTVVAEKGDGKVHVNVSGNKVTITEDDIASAQELTSEIARATQAETALGTRITDALGDGGSVATQITTAVGNIKNTDAEVSGEYIASVAQANGIVTPTRRKLVNSTDKLLSVDEAGSVNSTLTIKTVKEGLSGNTVARYDICGKGDNVFGSIEIPGDRFLKSAALSDDGNQIILTCNLADGTTTDVKCDISNLVSRAEFKNGLIVADNGEVSVKKNEAAADGKFLTIDAEGVGLTGITNAINAAVLAETNRATGVENTNSQAIEGIRGDLTTHTQAWDAEKGTFAKADDLKLYATTETFNSTKEILEASIAEKATTTALTEGLATKADTTVTDSLNATITTLNGGKEIPGSIKNIIEQEMTNTYLVWNDAVENA